MDAAAFRAMFPEFGDATSFPDSLVSTWLNVAALRVNAERWGDLTDTGLGYLTAHQLTLAKRNQLAVAMGDTPGQVSGPVAGKSVGKVSVNYFSPISALEGGGTWNVTDYGTQFIQLARLIGVGGAQL